MTARWTAPDIAGLRGDNTRPLQKIFASLTEYLQGLVENSRVLQTYVRNAETTTLEIGEVVYLHERQGDRATVKRASNTSDATSAKTLGVVAERIAPNADGLVTTQGYVYHMNLSAFTAGQTVYLSNVAGGITATKPVAPNHLVYVGVVVRANAGNGILYARAQNGYELDEIHDVLISSPTQGQVLSYNASTSLWQNSTFSDGGGLTNLNASNLASGTVPSARVSGSYTGITGVGTLSVGSIPSSLLTGTIASALLSGSYTGITAVGTLTGLTIGGAGANRSITINAPSGYYAIQYFAINGTNEWHYEVTPSGSSWSLVESGVAARLTMTSNSLSIYGSLYVGAGSGQYIQETTQTLINGTGQSGGIYLGGGTGQSATGGIETSWRGALNPSIAIGVTRDYNRTMMVCSYADSTVRLYAGNTEQLRSNTGGTWIDRIYGTVYYGSHGSISVYGTPVSGWYGIVFPAEATTWMSAANGQYFGCYRNNSTWNFYVVNGTFVPSDARYKRNINPLDVGTEFIRLIEPVSFYQLTEDPNDDPETTTGRLQYGFTTQNILSALSQIGQPDNVALVDIGGPQGTNLDNQNDRQYLNHSGLIAPIIRAIKEIDARLGELERNTP